MEKIDAFNKDHTYFEHMGLKRRVEVTVVAHYLETLLICK